MPLKLRHARARSVSNLKISFKFGSLIGERGLGLKGRGFYNLSNPAAADKSSSKPDAKRKRRLSLGDIGGPVEGTFQHTDGYGIPKDDKLVEFNMNYDYADQPSEVKQSCETEIPSVQPSIPSIQRSKSCHKPSIYFSSSSMIQSTDDHESENTDIDADLEDGTNHFSQI